MLQADTWSVPEGGKSCGVLIAEEKINQESPIVPRAARRCCGNRHLLPDHRSILRSDLYNTPHNRCDVLPNPFSSHIHHLRLHLTGSHHLSNPDRRSAGAAAADGSLLLALSWGGSF